MPQPIDSSSAVQKKHDWILKALYVIAGVLLAFLFAAADFGPDSDKGAYALYFDSIAHNLGVSASFDRIEPGFYGFTWLVSCITDSDYLFFWLIFLFQFFGLTSSWGKRSTLFRDRAYMTLLWLAFPMFYSLTLNVLRQGMALVFVVYAIDAELTRRRYLSFFLIALGALFHVSTLIFIPALLILQLGWRLRSVLILWLLCVIAAAASFPQYLVTLISTATPASISDLYPYYFSYLTGQFVEAYDVGFKFRFLAFSAIPVLAWFAVRQFCATINRESLLVLKLYLLLNAFFFLIGHIPFSDRIALLSWQLMPIIGLGLTPQRFRPIAASIALVGAIALTSQFLIL